MRTGLLVVVVLAGCGLSSQVDGTVEASVAEFKAKWRVSPNTCTSGQRLGFFGVDLTRDENEDTLVRVVSDPIDGYAVGTNIPGTDQSIFVRAADDCETFDVDVVSTTTQINDVWNVDGHAVVDCAIPGFTFKVDVNFASCH